MPDTLREQVAKIIYCEHFVLASTSLDPWKGADKIAKRKCLRSADAILALWKAREAALVGTLEMARKTFLHEGYNVDGPAITDIDATIAGVKA